MAETKQKKGIDVSRWQGNIDFEKLKGQVDFVILKCGGSDSGFYRDSKFERNYLECKRLGIPVGVYYFVGKNCVTANDGYADAVRFAEIIKGKKFEYPVYMDIEVTPPSKREGATDAVIAFCSYMEKKGYYAGVYASAIHGFVDCLNLSRLTRFDIWVASWGSKKPSTRKAFGMWQNSSTGKIDGINGNVDTDISYYDFPEIMKNKHLNGF